MIAVARDTVKDIAYRAISACGYRWTPRAYVADLDHWYHLRRLFADYRVDSIVDVGANAGQFRNFVRRRCGYRGLIVSFEPNPDVFEVLQRRASRDRRWLAVPCALGRVNGEAVFNITEDSVFSSLHEPKPMAQCDMRNTVTRRDVVPVRRLSDVIEELRPGHPLERMFLKIDTQGHDLEVLAGCGDALAHVVALQIEVAVTPCYSGTVPFETAIQRLNDHGFGVTGLFPVATDRASRVIEFDCVAVNSRMADRIGCRSSLQTA